MVSVQELYALWATDAYNELKETLGESLEPRDHALLRDTWARIAQKPGP